MKTLDKKELKELLNKCWMTHDAMWFFHCAAECGIETANKVNKAAVRSMAAIEIDRVRKAFGIERVSNREDLDQLIQATGQTLVADFMDFSYSFPSDNIIHFDMENCFAYRGVKRIGALEKYECGIFDRIESWLDHLKIAYSVSPSVTTCMMLSHNKCFRDYELTFPVKE